MNVARAQSVLDDMIEAERAPSSMDALRAIARRLRVSEWTLHNIKRGRPKAVKDTIGTRLEAAYIELCRRQLARWEHQLSIAEATSDDNFDDLRQAYADMAALIAARSAHLGDGGRRVDGRHLDRTDDSLTGVGSSSLHARR